MKSINSLKRKSVSLLLRGQRSSTKNAGSSHKTANSLRVHEGIHLPRNNSHRRRISEPVNWLWLGRIPLGKLTLVDGDPGLGKSALMADFAARVSAGCPWPDHSLCEAGGVVLLSAEDGLADTIRPRLDAAGGDASKVLALATVSAAGGERLVSIPEDLDVIRQGIVRMDANLVVVDPLTAFLSAGVVIKYFFSLSPTGFFSGQEGKQKEISAFRLFIRWRRWRASPGCSGPCCNTVAVIIAYRQLWHREKWYFSRCAVKQTRDSTTKVLIGQHK